MSTYADMATTRAERDVACLRRRPGCRLSRPELRPPRLSLPGRTLPRRVRQNRPVLVISRFRYDDDLTDRARTELETCLTKLGEHAGFVAGTVGRAMDDPTLWVLETTWDDVGSYRRALSSYEIKAHVVPLLSHAVDEPSAYEVIVGEGATEPNEATGPAMRGTQTDRRR